jgi:hypothetical protein
MEKRPISLTVVAVILVVVSLLAIAGIVMAQSNAELAAKMAEQSKVPVAFQQAWTVIGTIVTLIVAYGIFKGYPWSRVLYVAWGVIGLAVGFFMGSPALGMMLGFILLVVFSAILFSDRANSWFAARGFALSREDLPSR